MNCAIQDWHHHTKRNGHKPLKATGQMAQVTAISSELLQSLPMSIQCSVTNHGDSWTVDITGFNAAAKQIFRMDNPHGVPLSLVLQASGARLLYAMTRALHKNAASQRPVGRTSFASANLHALKFRRMCGLFTAHATLVYVLDHESGQGLLYLGADFPKVWQQVPSSKEVESSHHAAQAASMLEDSYSSEPEAMDRHTQRKLTWSSCLVDTLVFEPECNTTQLGPL